MRSILCSFSPDPVVVNIDNEVVSALPVFASSKIKYSGTDQLDLLTNDI